MFSKPHVKLWHVAAFIQLQKRTVKTRSIYHRSVDCLFKRYLFITNSVTSAGCMAIGDLIPQEYEYQARKIPERYDWDRLRHMAIVGGVLGSLHHFYYLYLDKFLPYRSFKTVLFKVAADQFFCAPLTILCFFSGMGVLANKKLHEIKEEIKEKFQYVYMGDWCFWPPVQAVNFYFVASKYRVFYINMATMVFDIFLSIMKHDF